jgi:two-component system response regulator BaeR
MVTAPRRIDRLAELGATIICKPFSPREVIARIKAVLRRASGQPSPGIHGLVLDKVRYKAILHDRDLDLTAVEFQLLQILASLQGRIFSRRQLMDRIYPDRRVVSDRTIDSHVKKLRRKIAVAAPGEDWVQSVYSVGYKFEPP